MDVHKTIDEPAPNFVHRINFDTFFQVQLYDNHGEFYYQNVKLELKDVSIKMETPVLYFYSKKSISNLMVNVNFPKGSIAEFYPMSFKTENAEYVGSKVEFLTSYPTLSFKNYNGFASWNINILAPEDLSKVSHPDELVPKVWLAPRKTKANLIEANGEIEKYIFYRGLGGFVNPIIPRYTKSGAIVLTNLCSSNIQFALIYEKTPDGKRYVWGQNSIIGTISEAFLKNKIEVSDAVWMNTYRKNFITALVKEGLYEDEAEAMLNTWDKSYFEKPGIKIFWIVPRSFTDEILPITFSKPIASLQRVMIGRTEIDVFKESEMELYLNDDPIKNTVSTYTLFPNPTTSDIFIRFNQSQAQSVKVEVTDFLGRLLQASNMDLIPSTDCKIPLGDLGKGFYFIKIKDGNSTHQYRISIQ